MSKKGDIKALFGGIAQAFKNFKGEEIKFGKSTLADGTMLHWEGDEPMPGMAVTAMPPDGSSAPAPAPDGEYVLPETGTTVKCEGGVIASVVPAASADENKPENKAANNAMSDNLTAQAKEIVERVEKVSKFAADSEVRFSSMEESIKTLSESLAISQKENEAYKLKMESFSKQITETIEAYGEEPQDTEKKELNFREEKDTNKKEADEIVSKLSFR